jgi:glycosyltransferase involved in cell wall biosynthesis
MRPSRGVLAASWNNQRRVWALRAAVRRLAPDCVVSVTDQMNILTLLACRPLQLPVVIAEHSDPRCQHLGMIREWLRRWTYRRAAAIVVLTESVAQHMRALARPAPVHVIPNGIAAPGDPAPGCPDRELLVVGLGRLSEEKGFDILLRAFAELAARHRRWQLEIAGEGDQRELLQRQIVELGLADRARLVGWVDQARPFLRRAAIFVLSSRYEGFPVALLEAMAEGLAVVSFDCPSGPREIVEHERNGLLVPPGDDRQLAAALERLIVDEPLRRRLSASARDVVTRFSAERFTARWNDVLRGVLPS